VNPDLRAKRCHPRESGDPVFHRQPWVPAFAGMTGGRVTLGCAADSVVRRNPVGCVISRTIGAAVMVRAGTHPALAIPTPALSRGLSVTPEAPGQARGGISCATPGCKADRGRHAGVGAIYRARPRGDEADQKTVQWTVFPPNARASLRGTGGRARSDLLWANQRGGGGGGLATVLSLLS